MRKPIEAKEVYAVSGKLCHVCDEPEVRELESHTAKLEARLGEAVELLLDINTCGIDREWEIQVEISKFLKTLDQEKEKSDEV